MNLGMTTSGAAIVRAITRALRQTPNVGRWLLAALVFLEATTFAATNPPVPAYLFDPFCSLPANITNRQTAQTLRMVKRLRDALQKADPAISPYLNDLAAERSLQALSRTTNTSEILRLRLEYSMQLLRAGKNTEAIEQLTEIPAFLQKNELHLNQQNLRYLRLQLGMAHLRLGEQENCLMNHTADSCLLPIQGSGVHQLTRGSRGAIEVFTDILKAQPNDLEPRWLLNIAYMTLGEYPQRVPEAWLIPPRVFESDYNLPRFHEAAGAAGLDVDDLAGGCIVEDFNGDGLLDVMVSSWSLRGQLRFFRNEGNGDFTERTIEAGLRGLTGSLNMMQTDYNNDGHPDVFMLRGGWLGAAGRHPNSLLRNKGNGTFEDVTEEAGLMSFHPTQTATWFDFDGDGWLDVFIGNESAGSEVHPCELFRNNGNGTFTECGAAFGVSIIGFVKGVTSGDFDNDGKPDLYISCRGQYNVLLHNEGPAPDHTPAQPAWKFVNVTQKAGVTEPVSSFPTWFFDYDNDGWLDLFVSSYGASIKEITADYLGLPHEAERAKLYHNNRDGTFSDVTKASSLYKTLHTMGCNFGDFDNDGWLDFYLGTGDPDFETLIPNRAFRNDHGTNFQEVTSSAGLGHLQKGHAVAVADLDNNGNQDIYAVMGGAYSGDNYRNALFVNPGNSNHWITLKLEGQRSNRPAVGARIRVQVETKSGSRTICKTVSSGGSFGASPFRQEIGLGDAQSIKAVEIFWPATGRTQTLTNLVMDRFYKIREGAERAEPWVLKQFQLAKKADPTKHTSWPHQHPFGAGTP